MDYTGVGLDGYYWMGISLNIIVITILSIVLNLVQTYFAEMKML